jgi:flagellar motility protein MotE (MotC chaperone)
MKSGYDQFFKDARRAADDGGGSPVRPRRSTGPRLNLDLPAEDIDRQIRSRMSMPAIKRKKKKSQFPVKLVSFSLVGALFAFWGVENHIEVENFLKRVEVTMTGEALAEDVKSSKEASPGAKQDIAKESDVKNADKAGEKNSHPANEDVSYLSKLTDRKKDLDAREEELNRQETELQAQKNELDNRIKELEGMRVKISSMLEERVKADDQKVETLVQVYSNMKPPQAAKVFETMDEDLVVEILGRMKKKNAADIMNLLKPEKAQIISEKYAGYKRR